MWYSHQERTADSSQHGHDDGCFPVGDAMAVFDDDALETENTDLGVEIHLSTIDDIDQSKGGLWRLSKCMSLMCTKRRWWWL